MENFKETGKLALIDVTNDATFFVESEHYKGTIEISSKDKVFIGAKLSAKKGCNYLDFAWYEDSCVVQDNSFLCFVSKEYIYKIIEMLQNTEKAMEEFDTFIKEFSKNVLTEMTLNHKEK